MSWLSRTWNALRSHRSPQPGRDAAPRGAARPAPSTPAAPAPQEAASCRHPEVAQRPGSPAWDRAVAESELASEGGLAHGAFHLANLLAGAPGDPAALALAERYVAAAGAGAEALLPLGEERPYTLEALRAFFWRSQGRLDEAVALLTEVARAVPAARYLEMWVAPWLEPAGGVEGLDPATALRLFARVLTSSPEGAAATVAQQRLVQRWSALCERFYGRHPADAVALMIRAGLLRKAGRLDEALALVEAVHAAAPTWHSATALGLVLRQRGDVAGAEAAFRAATDIDPRDASACMEAGDLLLDRAEWARALAWYEFGLVRSPDHEWGLPSALFCRERLAPDGGSGERLAALIAAGNQRAAMLAGARLGLGLPTPSDATANLLRDLAGRISGEAGFCATGNLRMGLSSLEAPSNYVAFRLAVAAVGKSGGLTVEATYAGGPDPRLPLAPIHHPLWRYDGIVAAPALPGPARDLVEAIGGIAATATTQERSWAAASRLAAGLDAARAAEVLAVMAHPPALPAGWAAPAWLVAVQLVAAQVIAHLDDGWSGSPRRAALRSALLGPQDWATEAAIRVLARLGRDDWSIAHDVDDDFALLARNRPLGYWGWESTLYECWQHLPHLDAARRAELARRREELDRDG